MPSRSSSSERGLVDPDAAVGEVSLGIELHGLVILLIVENQGYPNRRPDAAHARCPGFHGHPRMIVNINLRWARTIDEMRSLIESGAFLAPNYPDPAPVRWKTAILIPSRSGRPFTTKER